MPQLLYKKLWKECDENIRNLVTPYLDTVFGYNGEDVNYDSKYIIPKAVLLFEYYHDPEKVKELYLSDNKEAQLLKLII